MPRFFYPPQSNRGGILVEIKSRAFEREPQLLLRKELVERYIKWKGYDWKFKVVFDDEIILSEEQLEDFEECCKLKSKSAYKIWFEQVNRKYDRSSPSLFKTAYNNKEIEFAMFGKVRQDGGWQQ